MDPKQIARIHAEMERAMQSLTLQYMMRMGVKRLHIHQV